MFVPLQESSGPAPNTILPALVGIGPGKNIQSQLQAPRPDHGRPRHSVRTELAQRPGATGHTLNTPRCWESTSAVGSMIALWLKEERVTVKCSIHIFYSFNLHFFVT